jgi:hypothetical protein
MYCGHHIMLDGQSNVAYKSKVRIKEMEHKERLQDKRDQQEKYRIEQKRYKAELEKKETKWNFLFGIGVLAAIILICGAMSFLGNAKMEKQEQKLQSIVEAILVDVENENFAAAYVKANSLYWDSGYSNRGEEKWNAIREELIDQIKKAEAAASSETQEEQPNPAP